MNDFRAIGRNIKRAFEMSDVTNWMRDNPELAGAGIGGLGGAGIGALTGGGKGALMGGLAGAGLGAGAGYGVGKYMNSQNQARREGFRNAISDAGYSDDILGPFNDREVDTTNGNTAFDHDANINNNNMKDYLRNIIEMPADRQFTYPPLSDEARKYLSQADPNPARDFALGQQ